jgi:hypothetical protein
MNRREFLKVSGSSLLGVSTVGAAFSAVNRTVLSQCDKSCTTAERRGIEKKARSIASLVTPPLAVIAAGAVYVSSLISNDP